MLEWLSFVMLGFCVKIFNIYFAFCKVRLQLSDSSFALAGLPQCGSQL